MEVDRQSKLSKSDGWFIAGGLVIVIAIANPFIIMLLSRTGFTVAQINDLGTVGDFFGGTTVGLLSLASIFFVIHTIKIQGKELELTRKEFETGNTTAKVQQIDNAFFNMLSLHQQIVNDINFKYILNGVDYSYKGREAISKLNEECQQMLAEKIYSYDDQIKWTELGWESREKLANELFALYAREDVINQKDLDEVYKKFHNQYGNYIGHYMRFNYRIVKFIVNNVANNVEDQEKIKSKTGQEPIIGDRRYYFGMLRAQWSNSEFELILINALYKENSKFMKLIIEHDVLDIKADLKDKNIFILKSKTVFNAFKSLIEEFRTTEVEENLRN